MNGGYDPEALMQQYRDWEGQQWQPPTWGQPPPVTVDRGQLSGRYPSPWQVPVAESARRMVDEPLTQYWGLPSTAAVGGGAPPISTGIQAPQVSLPQAPRGRVRVPPWQEWYPSYSEWADKAWKAAEYSPWQAMGEQARHLIGEEREAIETFREAPSWQAGAELLGSSMDVLGKFPTVPWAGGKRGLLKLKEITTGSVGKQFFQDLLQDTTLFTEEARNYFDKNLDIGITEPYSQEGSGFFQSGRRPEAVRLRTTDTTTAIHELSHAWWEDKRPEERDAFIEAMIRFADESKQYFQTHMQTAEAPDRARNRAILSVYGEPDPPAHSQGARISGPKVATLDSENKIVFTAGEQQWNDQEMYAYMAMEISHDINLLPPYLHRFYEGLFTAPPAWGPGSVEWGYGDISPEEWGHQDLWPKERALITQKRRESAYRKQP